MKRMFIPQWAFLLLCSVLAWPAAMAQHAKDTEYFNFNYSKVSDWSAIATSPFTATVDGDQLIFGGGDTYNATRTKDGYTGAVRCQSIELPEYASLGYFDFFAQNGSSGTSRTLYVRVSIDNGNTWSTVETIEVGGSEARLFKPLSVLSKKKVKVKIDSDGKYFWFYKIEAWSSTLASTDPNEAPEMLVSLPADGEVVPSSGTINVQFDELVKAGTGVVTFGDATVNTTFLGNTLQIDYSGLTGSSNTLDIPAGFVQNHANINLMSDISLTYTGDIVDPIYVSADPVSGSDIIIRDVLKKIVLTFDENIALGAGTITFGPATVTPIVSGKTLIIGYSGLQYENTYDLIIPAEMIMDISGNTYKNEIKLTYTTLAKDDVAPLLVSKSVADDETNVPVGGSIYFVFDEIVQVGTGSVTLNGKPVNLSFNEKMVGINYNDLDYNDTYEVSIPQGVLTDTTGNEYLGITFSFTTKAHAFKDFDIIVAQDGSGDFTTIQAAINSVSGTGSERTFIFVKNGTYNEKILVNKPNISLIGHNADGTIIQYNDGASTAGGTDNSYTIKITGTGFYAENFTIRNTFGQGSQAVALMTDGDKQVFKNIKMYGFQDTHYPKRENTRNYYLNCFIEGATDFMFGGATAFYEDCAINCINGGQYITAPSGNAKEFGLVYNNCTITAEANVADSKFYLGRPWKDNAKTVWLNTKLDNQKLREEGWAVWATGGDDADNHLTGFFAEYNTMDLSGVPYNPTRAPWGVKLTADEAVRYTIDNAFNYGVNSDTWNPLPFTTSLEVPSNLVESQGVLTWDAVQRAVAYVVFRNGSMIGTTTQTTFTDVSAPPVSNGATHSYIVKAVNEYGAQSVLSDESVLLSVKGSAGLDAMGIKLYPNPFTDVISIQNKEQVQAIEFYNEQGQLIKRISGASVVRTSDLEGGLYMVKVITNMGDSYIKMMKH